MLATIDEPIEDEELPRKSKLTTLRRRAQKRVTALMFDAVKIAREEIVAEAEAICDDLESAEFDSALIGTLSEWKWADAIDEADSE